jgi:hypothetical protein
LGQLSEKFFESYQARRPDLRLLGKKIRITPRSMADAKTASGTYCRNQKRKIIAATG